MILRGPMHQKLIGENFQDFINTFISQSKLHIEILGIWMMKNKTRNRSLWLHHK